MSVSFTQLRQTIDLAEKVKVDGGEKIVKTEKVGRKKNIEVTITTKGGKFFVYFDGEKYAGQYRDEKSAQQIVKDYLKLVGEELTEVRGKVGSSDGDEEADKNIMMQLRKVVSLRGMKPVTFNDGKQAKVNPKDAEKLLSIYDRLKPASKMQLQTVLAKSKRDFDNAMKQLAKFEEVELDEGALSDKWRKGARSVKVGKFELVRGNSGVHKILKDRKPFGDLSLDDEAGMWVGNMKGMKGQWTGREIDDLFAHLKKAHEELDEAKEVLSRFRDDRLKQTIINLAKQKGLKVKDMGSKIEVSGNGRKVMDLTLAVQKQDVKVEQLEEGKSSTGYELYHRDFSSAMKHAYDHAKKKFKIDVDPKEIDDKVASGPRKPSKGKTNSYRLLDKDGKRAIQVQVYGMDNGKYELNMYKEEFELTEESSTIAKVKEIASKKQAMKIDGVMVDMFTASAISQIYDKVNDANKAKMDKLKVTKLADLAMKMMKREQVEFNEEIISEAMMTWEVKVTKGINKLKKGTVVKVKARNTSEAMRKAGKEFGDPIAVKMSGYFDAKPIKEEISES